MKLSAAPLTAILLSCLSLPVHASNVEEYIQQAEKLQLDQHITWQRLMYADQTGQSEVSYSGYFYHPDGQKI